MRYHIAPLIGGLLFASALSLSAQTFTEDNTLPPGINTFTRVDGLSVFAPNTTGFGDGIVFNNVKGGGIPNPYVLDPIGISVTEVTTSSGTVTAYDLCAELFVGPNNSSSYGLSDGFGSLSAGQQVLVAKLLSNTLTGFITTYDDGNGDYTQASIEGAAIQIALWEIIEDQNDLALNGGDLSINGYSGSYSGDAKASMELAQTYLTSLNGWSDLGGVNYYYADHASEQDRLWLTTGSNTIPEPSTALLGLLSMGFLLRRKRA